MHLYFASLVERILRGSRKIYTLWNVSTWGNLLSRLCGNLKWGMLLRSTGFLYLVLGLFSTTRLHLTCHYIKSLLLMLKLFLFYRDILVVAFYHMFSFFWSSLPYLYLIYFCLLSRTDLMNVFVFIEVPTILNEIPVELLVIVPGPWWVCFSVSHQNGKKYIRFRT